MIQTLNAAPSGFHLLSECTQYIPHYLQRSIAFNSGYYLVICIHSLAISCSSAFPSSSPSPVPRGLSRRSPSPHWQADFSDFVPIHTPQINVQYISLRLFYPDPSISLQCSLSLRWDLPSRELSDSHSYVVAYVVVPQHQIAFADPQVSQIQRRH